MTDYATVRTIVQHAGLEIFGVFHPVPSDDVEDGVSTLLMLGPLEPEFWPQITSSPEFTDGMPDPIDRWSRRVIGGIGHHLKAQVYFPFDGPPWWPFIQWAKRTGRAWESEVGILVHDEAGLMVSYRGALGLRKHLELPKASARPCDTCPGKPCRDACPVGALTQGSYDVPACKEYLSTPKGSRTCMAAGCRVRRACPISQTHGRRAEQSAFHMSYFHR